MDRRGDFIAVGTRNSQNESGAESLMTGDFQFIYLEY